MKLGPTEAAVHEFLRAEMLTARNLEALGLDDSLFQLGAIDSIAVARLVAFCEERFSITIPDRELVPENFESVRAIAQMVGRLRKDAG
jgi:acyl carrier protein